MALYCINLAKLVQKCPSLYGHGLGWPQEKLPRSGSQKRSSSVYTQRAGIGLGTTAAHTPCQGLDLSRGLKDSQEQPQRYVGEEGYRQGNSLCKGPEAGVCVGV